MAIKIKGVIGWDVNGDEFAERLNRLDGDITFEINSPGGSVFHGITIYNAIKNYNRGKCTMHVVGDCSSMAAYIMLAGDGDVLFEPNSIVVLHNPYSFTQGDYKAMYKEGKVLEQMAELYANAFVKRGLFDEKEIRQIMDDETWFIGENDLGRLGKVLSDESGNGDDNQEDDDEQTTPEIKIAALKERMNLAQEKLRALKIDNVEQIAALISKDKIEARVTTTQAQAQTQEKPKTVEQKENKKGEEKMDLQELQAKEPKLYAEIFQMGVNAERKRVTNLNKFAAINPQAVSNAIEKGLGANDPDFTTEILMAQVSKKEIQGMQEENPKDIQPQVETHEPEGKVTDPNAQKSDEDKAKAEKEALAKITTRMRMA